MKILVVLIIVIVFFYVTSNVNYKSLNLSKTAYRLGDMFKHPGYFSLYYKHILQCRYFNGEKYHLQLYPNSIASLYMKKTKEAENYKVLINIIDEKRKEGDYKEVPPDNVIVIHLRLGDVIEREKKSLTTLLLQGSGGTNDYIKPLKYFENRLKMLEKYNIKNIIIVSGTHHNINLERSTDYIRLLKLNLENLGYYVRIKFETGKQFHEQADDDFIYMSNAKYFISSGGGYSKIIKNIVNMKGCVAL